MNGKIVTAALAVAIIAAALVPMVAEDSEGEREYALMDLMFYDKEGGRVLLGIGLSGPDFIVPSDIPSVPGGKGWTVEGVDYYGRDLVGTSFKSYAVPAASHQGIVVLEAYPIFDDPAPSPGGEESEGLDSTAVGAILIAGVLIIALMAVMFLRAGADGGGGGSDPYGRYEPYSPWYKRP